MPRDYDKEHMDNKKKESFLKSLGIKFIEDYGAWYISTNHLYEILTDEDKLKELVSKVKNKAFL